MKLPLSTERMFSLMEYVLKNNINGCNTQEKFFISIGYFSFGNKSNVEKGVQGFKVGYYQNAIDVYNLDANYFFKKDAPMFEVGKNISAIKRLDEAVALIRRELQDKKRVTKTITKNSRKATIRKNRPVEKY